VFIGESSLSERIDSSGVGVLDSEDDEGCSFVLVEEVSEFFTEEAEMKCPRNHVPECDDSSDCVLDARNSSVAESSNELSVPVKDLIVV
jgi:hypothetical protein